jgi:hypothetical protein
MLDLPVARPTAWDERIYEAWTDRIPALGTPVEVIFEVLRPNKAP